MSSQHSFAVVCLLKFTALLFVILSPVVWLFTSSALKAIIEVMQKRFKNVSTVPTQLRVASSGFLH